MKFEIIAVFARSLTFEITSEQVPYELDTPYEIEVDGQVVATSRRLVETVTGLTPGREIELALSCLGERISQRVSLKSEPVRLNVRQFGAAGDGTHNDTAAIQAAIQVCPQNGTVYLPAGTYLSGPLFLKSDMTLELGEGAMLLGDPDRTHYPVLPGMVRATNEHDEYNFGTWEGNPLGCFASLITAMDCADIDIVGPGVIDGGAMLPAADWWQVHREKRGAWRPRTIFLSRCRNVRMQNVTVQNSPAWTIHPYYSDHLQFLNLYIQNPSDSPNTDGLDPESCADVLVAGTRISVGDDCMAIKSGKYYMAQAHYKPTVGIRVRNCLLERGHGSVTVGSECAGGVQDVTVKNCIFRETDRGLRVKTRRGRGDRSLLDRILFTNIRMDRVRMPFTVNMFYFCDPDGHSSFVQDQSAAEVTELTPKIGSITARNIVCTGANACLLCAIGLPEMPIGRVELENIRADFLPEGERHAERPVMMDNIEEMSGRSVVVRNCQTLVLKNVSIAGSADDGPELVYVAKREIEGLNYEVKG
ncbi:MAG: glycoside hydrolase family 28 protein [Butyrivibrio sp.]|nr:glycoside hydrolase family 28 protein [Butyrivibrio sp.]